MPDCLYTPSPCAWTLCFCIKRSVVNQWLIPGDKILEIQRKRVGRGDRGHNSLKSLYPTEYCRPDYYAGTNVDNIIIIKKLLLKWSVYFFFSTPPSHSKHFSVYPICKCIFILLIVPCSNFVASQQLPFQPNLSTESETKQTKEAD